MRRTIILISLVVLFFDVSYSQKSIDLMTKSVEYFNAGNLEKAIIYAEDAVKESEKEDGKESYFYTFMCNKRNFIYINAGELKKAKKGCDDNFILLSKLVKQDKELYQELYIESLSLLSNYYQQVGNRAALDTLLLQLIDYYPDENYDKAIAYNNLAAHYREKGYSYKSEPLYFKAVSIYAEVEGKDQNYATMLSNLGAVYWELGLYEKAEYYFSNSLEVLKTVENPYYKQKISENVSNNLANVYIHQKKYDEAEKILLANKKNQDKNKKTHEYLYTTFSLGTLYMYKRNGVLAEKYFKESLLVSEKLFGKNNPFYASSLNALALVANLSNDKQKAEGFYNESLQIIGNNSGSNNINYIINLRNLANLHYTQKKYEKSLFFFKQVLEKTIQQLQSNFIILTEKEKYQYTKQNSTNLEAFQNLAFDYHNEKPEIIGDVFNNLLFYKKLILFNTKSFKQLVENSNDTSIQKIYSQLIEIKREIANSHTHNLNTESLKKLQIESENTEKELVRQINEKYPNNNINFELHTFKDIQNSLKENEVIVEFTHFQRHNNEQWTDTTYYCALILRKNYDYPKLVYLGTEKELENILKNKNPNQHIASYIKNLYEPSENGLYSFVWQKIEPFLNNNEQVHISPSGLIHNISFACIVDNNKKMLKDKYKLSYLTSSANILNNRHLYLKELKNITFMGGVKYDLDSTEINKLAKEKKDFANMRTVFLTDNNTIKLSFLPSTITEIDSITKILNSKNKNINTLLGADANEDTFYQITENKIDILHIATHGFYYPKTIIDKNEAYNFFNKQVVDNTLFRSGLFLAGAQNSLNNENSFQNIEDGILSSYEISLQDLSNTKLVVLSACQTGLGDIKGNEGVEGLSRAFKIAGVEYILMSLWEVPSFQTAELMQLFYTYFSKDQSIEDAFTNAQQTMSKKYNNPYFWAGFILIH